MSAVKKIMKALGFAKKEGHPHLSIVKHPGDGEGAIIVEMPLRKYVRKENLPVKDLTDTIVIDITH